MTSNLERYEYELPRDLIATEPALPRDKARLLVYSKKEGKISYDIFLNLNKYLPKNAILVFNQTRVIPARLFLNKETGGKVEILYLNQKNNLIEVLANRELKLGSGLFLNNKKIFEVVNQNKNIYYLKLSLRQNVLEIFEKYGAMPIPPYIKNTRLSEKELRERYQSVFAKELGSAAAPTASLHFTKRLLNKLNRNGNEIKFVTLHVGLGTFAPLKEEDFKKGKLHSEYYRIDKKTAEFLKKAKKAGKPIIAVGTTVARVLESAVSGKLEGETELFIQEGYKFKVIDGLVTNFHLPESSLLVLVSAFMGREKLFDCYKEAINKKFKFYSFGDGMLII